MKMTNKDSIELVKKYSEEMPSVVAAKVLNDLAAFYFCSEQKKMTKDNEIYLTIVRESQNPSESFTNEDEEDKAVTNHPKRYLNKSGIEAIDIIELFVSGMNGGSAFNLGTAVKYLSRLGKKTTNVREEWNKVLWYMNRFIDTDFVVVEN